MNASVRLYPISAALARHIRAHVERYPPAWMTFSREKLARIPGEVVRRDVREKIA